MIKYNLLIILALFGHLAYANETAIQQGFVEQATTSNIIQVDQVYYRVNHNTVIYNSDGRQQPLPTINLKHQHIRFEYKSLPNDLLLLKVWILPPS